MASRNLPSPSLIVSDQQARRLMLAHHKLWPPRQLRGKDGALEYIKHVGCIQFDPINKAGRNPDLVLQSRVKDYRPELLYELLYEDRALLDGWDKLSSIYPVSDWPYFERHRSRMREQHSDPANPAMKIAPDVIETIRTHGPQSSIDFKHDQTVQWAWGQSATLARTALEVLYAMGDLVIHHRVGTRRYFDLTRRALPDTLLAKADPNVSDEDYHDWHVQRRVRGLGIADPGGTDHWLGITGVKSVERRRAIKRLVERGDLIPIAIESHPDRTLLMHTTSLAILDGSDKEVPKRAAVIAALDNFIWDRKMLSWIFDFDYTWEVYVPAAKRKYGYYVLPILYGDSFIGRFEPIFDGQSRTLLINNWWWEEGINVNDRMRHTLNACMLDFISYLQANSLALAPPIKGENSLDWLAKIG